jgi:hypothetical protein
MSNVINFPKPQSLVMGFERQGYTLKLVQDDTEYKILENGKTIAIYGSMIKALSYFYKHKEAANVVHG